MNRRSFFSTLAKAGTGLLFAPSIFVPVAQDRFRWRNPRWIENPMWVKAEYEICFIEHPAAYDHLIFTTEQNQSDASALASRQQDRVLVSTRMPDTHESSWPKPAVRFLRQGVWSETLDQWSAG